MIGITALSKPVDTSRDYSFPEDEGSKMSALKMMKKMVAIVAQNRRQLFRNAVTHFKV